MAVDASSRRKWGERVMIRASMPWLKSTRRSRVLRPRVCWRAPCANPMSRISAMISRKFGAAATLLSHQDQVALVAALAGERVHPPAQPVSDLLVPLELRHAAEVALSHAPAGGVPEVRVLDRVPVREDGGAVPGLEPAVVRRGFVDGRPAGAAGCVRLQAEGLLGLAGQEALDGRHPVPARLVRERVRDERRCDSADEHALGSEARVPQHPVDRARRPAPLEAEEGRDVCP